MSDLNITTITGRLVRDPMLRRGESGNAWATFTLASNYHYRDKQGQFQEEAAFISCKAFGRIAESLARHKKGDTAIASGRLRTESWEKEGRTQSQTNLICDLLRFVTPQNGSSPSSGASESDPPCDEGSNARDGGPPF
jgi:single-strand DNA-binding protein